VILGPKGKPEETYSVPHGAVLLAEEGQHVKPGTPLCRWDPHITPIVAELGGRIRFDEIVEGHTLRKERDKDTGAERWEIMEHKAQ
jgi:DNA-directed RNA polymerase subunit beta'